MMSSLEKANRSNLAESRFQLDLANDIGLVGALRRGEESFNSDVLPRDAELMAPRDVYAALASGPPRTRPTTRGERASRFPYLAV